MTEGFKKLSIVLKLNITVCVVLYNPPTSVIKNLIDLSCNFQHVFVNDNSEVSTLDIDYLKSITNNVEFIANNDNLGIAYSLNLGLKFAKRKKSDWVLTLDQDSILLNYDFINDFNIHIQNDKLGLFFLSFENKFNCIENIFYNNNCVITSGSILRVKAWEQIGGFEEKLFIDEVDNDFCIRLLFHNYLICSTRDIYLSHVIGEQKIFFIKKKKILISEHNPLRTYYIFRNSLFVIWKYKFINKQFVIGRIKNLIKEIYYILKYLPNKKLRLNYAFNGVKAFLNSKYGRI